MSFSTFNLCPSLIAAMTERFESPTEIQSLTLPHALQGKDVLSIAQTGSGKTLAYGLPLLQQVRQDKASIQAVVLVPTRELATQVDTAIAPLAERVSLSSMAVCGGVDIEWQKQQLAKNPSVIVATPGRLLDLIQQQALSLNDIKHVVLDEVDRLMDMGFWPDVQKILSAVPTNRQTLMFSATLSDALDSKVAALLNDPIRVQSHNANSVASKIEERLYLVNKGNKANVLIHQIKHHQWPQVLVFISARDNADALCKKLAKAGLVTAALHGNKDQIEREQTLQAFKTQKIQVLIATDLLARGIHVDQLPVVINYELPADPTVYVHRVGRTARAGEQGLAMSLVCHAETGYLEAIRSLTSRPLALQQLSEFPVTDQPASTESKRPRRDKQANRRTNKKSGAKSFKSKR
ncbi:DEAD/DEAH box helicase [Vibrio sp. 10N.286.49.C2]|uniref:DEAD/DEAH box helicase n=1 Tax=unclassified Vibrio TaxID=2614977 RepID=UPI000C8299CF|nr:MULTISPECIES: DEAD/DEAH box helicase [unclassified Vibrio]PMH38860.1 DEAD/DEAH box helicase [Vibrio sp. 10N.286.49.C2]PMH55335.1 DEAD/DEAH box helicase [Vibrio sp. 10N.286.49.B1]PMH78843.1 DEAD/DEAH box helicase [Vibrio sp. 10N.286.48.B7]